MAELVNFPFAGSGPVTQTANAANAQRPLVVSGGSISVDTPGQTLNLPAGSYGILPGASPVDLSKAFTFSGWLKATGATNTYLLLQFAGTDRFASLTLGSAMATWTRVLIQQTVTAGKGSISVSLNNTPAGSGDYPDGWGMPTGLVLYNDELTSATGGCSYAQISLYEGVVREQLLGPVTFELRTSDTPAPTLPGQLGYYLNGKPLASWGITVEASFGVIDPLERKPGLTYDWADGHGEAMDLSAPRYLSRSIRLKCWQFAVSPEAYLDAIQSLETELSRPGTQRLHINLFGGKPLVYEVVRLGLVEMEKQWRPGPMTGTFELTLKEPQPVKRVLSFTGPGTVELALSTTSALAIHWGDGLHSPNIYGQNQKISHTYAGTGTYYLILAGVLDDITTLTHNATLVWNRL